MNSKIEKVIIKFFDNEASLTELSSLLHWINNEKNYAQYVEYISINHLTNLALNKLDQEKIIEEINSRINSNKKPSIKKRALVFTNVAYVLCSLVIIFYLFSKGNLNDDLKSIDPNKITLTTENGNVIDLENLKENNKKASYILFNPSVIQYSEETVIMEEGCLSLPEQYADVERPKEIILEYMDENEKIIKKQIDGYEARILQHEIDHLSGKLFVDYLSSLKRNVLIKKVKKLQHLKK